MSPKKQKECFEFITEGKKTFGLRYKLDPDYDIVMEQIDRTTIMLHDDTDNEYFNIREKEESNSESSQVEYTPNHGRELIKLYTLICDSQHMVQSFILNYTSNLVNEENIGIFIEYGVMNGYIKKNKKFKSIEKKKSSEKQTNSSKRFKPKFYN